MINNNSIKFFKENYLVISLLCYGIGLITTYCNFVLFSIPIWYYISLTDILLYPVIQVTITTFILLFYAIFYKRLIRIIIVTFFRRYRNRRLVDKVFTILPAIFIFIIIVIFEEELSGKDMLILLYMLPIAFLLLDIFSRSTRPRMLKFTRRIILIYSAILLVSLVLNSRFKLLSNKNIITFTYNDTIQVKTINSKFYIGETSTHLIIYDTISKMSEIYKKENIDNLKYYSNVSVPKKMSRRPNDRG